MPERDVRLLRFLRQASGPQPMSAVVHAAGCSSEEISAGLAALMEAGYEISQHPHLGIRLDRTPDRLIADDMLARLEGVELARRIFVFEKTGSTNDVATQLAREGAPEGTVVFAETQSAGRGRLGRSWESAPHEGLWFSIVLRPPLEAKSWIRFTTWAAVAAAEALQPLVHRSVQIKWPNDLLIEDRKVTGILLEGHHHGSDGFLIAGLGVNVNQASFPTDLRIPAVSLRQITGAPLDRMDLATRMLGRLNALYPVALQNPSELSAMAWDRSSIRELKVEVTGGPTAQSGLALGLDEEGALRVKLPDGTITVISTGELSVRKSET